MNNNIISWPSNVDLYSESEPYQQPGDRAANIASANRSSRAGLLGMSEGRMGPASGGAVGGTFDHGRYVLTRSSLVWVQKPPNSCFTWVTFAPLL